MATATPTHGSRAAFKLNAVDVTDHLQGDIGSKSKYDTVDTTVFGAAAATHIPSPIEDMETISGSCLFDATTHNALRVLKGVAGTTWTFSPIGTTTGNAQQTGTGTMTEYEVKAALNGGATMINWSFEPSGTGTWGTAP